MTQPTSEPTDETGSPDGGAVTAGSPDGGAVTAGSPDGGPGGERSARLVVVGIGASAGGLEALEALVGRLAPSPEGMAFVVLQHLAPGQSSALSGILGRSTSMKMVLIEDGQRLAPNTIFVAPPSVEVALQAGALRLTRQHEGLRHSNRRAVPLARHRAGAGRHRRHPLGRWQRRHPRAQGDQRRGWHHLRPGAQHGEPEQHAAERARRRMLRFLPGTRRDRRRAGAPGVAPSARRQAAGAAVRPEGAGPCLRAAPAGLRGRLLVVQADHESSAGWSAASPCRRSSGRPTTRSCSRRTRAS